MYTYTLKCAIYGQIIERINDGCWNFFEHTIFVLTFVEILRIHPIQWGACTFLDKFTPDINKVCCNMAILSQEINLGFNLRCKLIILG